MQQSRGTLSVHRLFGLRELGLSNTEPHVDKIINFFLSLGEAIAARWIEMPKGILLLQMDPTNPASGAIYLYDRIGEVFYLVSFEGPDDNLTREEFDRLLPEYALLQYLERPSLLFPTVHVAAA